jgi:cation transport regulator ChaB
MPYQANSDLPKPVRDALPSSAETIWRNAFNAAWHQYGESEARAASVAWSAVKNAGYLRAPDGQWVTPSEMARVTYTPTPAMQRNARMALDVRAAMPPSRRGMTPVGLARARDIANGRPLSYSVIERMLRYFQRHEVDKQASTWADRGRGWQAWNGWGGDDGWVFADMIVSAANAR